MFQKQMKLVDGHTVYLVSNWMDARIFGTIVRTAGDKWMVKWDIDNDAAAVESENLFLECDDTAKQVLPASTSHVETSGGKDLDALQIGSGEALDTLSNGCGDDLDGSKDGSNQDLLKDGDTVRLVNKFNLTLFKASYVKTSAEVVHNHKIPKNHGKFLITECFVEELIKWGEYDPDIHVCNTYIVWDKSYIHFDEEIERDNRGNVLEKVIPDDLLVQYNEHYKICKHAY